MATERPLEQNIQRRFIPFALVGLLAPLDGTHFPPRGLDGRLACRGSHARDRGGRLLVPWSRLARWTYIVPPLAYFVVVALLREARDGSLSGCPLALIPVVDRVEPRTGAGRDRHRRGTSVFVLPLIVGDPESYTTRLATRRAVGSRLRHRRLLRRVTDARAAGAHAPGARPRADDGRDRGCHVCLTAETDAANAHLQCDARARRRKLRRYLGARRFRRAGPDGSRGL